MKNSKNLNKKLPLLSDKELLGLYKKNRQVEVLGELYGRYIHLVYGVALKYFKNREESKDTVNEIFESIIDDIPKFDIANFKSWLYVVVKNHCLMELRKQKRLSEKKQAFLHEEFMESTEIIHPIENSDADAMHEQLKHCLEQLKIEQKQSIELFYYKKQCYKEIADNMAIEEKKVKSLIQNGKRNLKLCLEKEEASNE